MINTKQAAMKRIADDTDRFGSSDFPLFMMENMRRWEREGLVKVTVSQDGNRASITESGRKLANKMSAR